MPATYEPIATTTLGTAASSISFTSIPGTYTDLRVVLVYSLSISGRNLGLTFNSDTGSNYSRTTLTGNGSSASSFRQTSQERIVLNEFGGNTSVPKLSTIDIFSYTASVNKTVLSTNSADDDGSGETNRTVGLWRNTSAITTLGLVSLNADFNTGTTATLYGILKA
jgi:hypothetical protein